MHKPIIATSAILAASLLVSGSAEAGASGSAASKYTHNTTQVAAYQMRTNRQVQRSDFAITEFSSSSVRTHAAKNR